MALKTDVTAKTTTISLRTSPSELDVIDRAAMATGRSRTDFVLEASRREAEAVLLDRVYFRLNDEAFAAFEALVDATPEPSEALRSLLEKEVPWQKSPSR
jgi:uncharacterized protein (DUF1778 family)